MQAEIITIGDEILIGQIVDTNAAHIARELNRIGISVCQITSVQDDKKHILQALQEAGSRAEAVIITGGLGPTKDDITKHTLCEFLDDTLVRNETVLAHIEALFARYTDTPISDLNRNQAMVPSGATVLMNRYGTAPGMWLEKDRTVFISLPGVPYEMKALMNDEVLPRLQSAYERPYILHKTIVTYGMGESTLAGRIEAWENSLPSFVKLAYLPHPGKVLLRLTAKGTDRELLETTVDEKIGALYSLIGDMIHGQENDEPLEALIGKAMSEKKVTLALAESCTGGRLAEQVTSVPGASAYFRGGVLSYATAVKTGVLKVPAALIEMYSVVSAEVAEAMARGAQQVLKSDFAIATTGNAGPAKGESDAGVGTVYIGVATPDKVYSQKFNFGAPREKVIDKAANKALEMLWKEILKN